MMMMMMMMHLLDIFISCHIYLMFTLSERKKETDFHILKERKVQSLENCWVWIQLVW